jgi:hypothetical protein
MDSDVCDLLEVFEDAFPTPALNYFKKKCATRKLAPISQEASVLAITVTQEKSGDKYFPESGNFFKYCPVPVGNVDYCTRCSGGKSMIHTDPSTPCWFLKEGVTLHLLVKVSARRQSRLSSSWPLKTSLHLLL